MTDVRRIVALGSDAAAAAVDGLATHLEAAGLAVVAVGAVGGAAAVSWPQVGEGVARLVAQGLAGFGIVCCETGTGVSIAANKVPGIRAALCGDAATASGARRWNDANVLALGLSGLTADGAIAIADAFRSTQPDAGEAAALARLMAIERRYARRAATPAGGR